MIISEQIRRTYPRLSKSVKQPSTPISFVVVRYSDEYLHNFLRSECVGNPINEIIEVDNTANLHFNNLSQAMMCGIEQTHHNLIAVVHEDVLLVDDWQIQFECSLAALEKYDNEWAIIGSVGWLQDGTITGHWSDPYRYENTFKEIAHSFVEVERLDEQILIFHRSRLPKFDEELPGIHHIGIDLSLGYRQTSLKTYVIDAPTIHKYADDKGELVQSHKESKKIVDRQSLTYLADKACCDDYILHKWPELRDSLSVAKDFSMPDFDPAKLDHLSNPVILISRGGSGSRLLSIMAEDAGIFLGNNINSSGDSMELVIPFYRAITEKFRCSAGWQKEQITTRIICSAAAMIVDLPNSQLWGFKLPESVFLLPELMSVFPNAKYIHFVRDPVSTCHRRTHMTARLDNHIGRITLPEAYDYVGIERTRILEHSAAEHMAYTTIHQLELVQNFFSKLPRKQKLEIRFENVLSQPSEESKRLCSWLKKRREGFKLESTININRAGNPKICYQEEISEKTKLILREIRAEFGYKGPVNNGAMG